MFTRFPEDRDEGPFVPFVRREDFINSYGAAIGELQSRHAVHAIVNDDEVTYAHAGWISQLQYQIRQGKIPFSAGNYRETLGFLCLYMTNRPIVTLTASRWRSPSLPRFQQLLLDYPTQTVGLYVCLTEYRWAYEHYEKRDPNECMLGISVVAYRDACEAMSVHVNYALDFLEFFPH